MGSHVSSKTESISDKEDKLPLAPAGGTEGPHHLAQAKPAAPLVGLIKEEDKNDGPVAEQEINVEPQCQGVQSHKASAVCEYIHQYPNLSRAPDSLNSLHPGADSRPKQPGKYREAKGSLLLQSSDQCQPASAMPIMQAFVAAGLPQVSAMPYSSYIPYNPQQFPGQPATMQPMAQYPSELAFAPMLQSNSRMLLLGSHPQAMVSSSTPSTLLRSSPSPKPFMPLFTRPYPHHVTQLHAHQSQLATMPTGSQPESQRAALSPV
ncbi:Ataxin-2-like protein [Plecturocebus cupreus]